MSSELTFQKEKKTAFQRRSFSQETIVIPLEARVRSSLGERVSLARETCSTGSHWLCTAFLSETAGKHLPPSLRAPPPSSSFLRLNLYRLSWCWRRIWGQLSGYLNLYPNWLSYMGGKRYWEWDFSLPWGLGVDHRASLSRMKDKTLDLVVNAYIVPVI